MSTSKKNRPRKIRFSPASLLCLLLCWVGLSGLTFYLGTLVGRIDQMQKTRRVYRASEGAASEEDLPPLSFPEELTKPSSEEEVSSFSRADGFPGNQGLKPSTEGGSVERKVLQVASFREPERAEHLVLALKEKGYRCFRSMSSQSDSGEPFARVFVGPLPNTEKALEIKARLEQQEGYRDILIRSAAEKGNTF